MKIVNVSGNSQVTVEEAPRPRAGPGQVVIQTVMSALCGSEMHDYRKAGYGTAKLHVSFTLYEIRKGLSRKDKGTT